MLIVAHHFAPLQSHGGPRYPLVARVPQDKERHHAIIKALDSNLYFQQVLVTAAHDGLRSLSTRDVAIEAFGICTFVLGSAADRHSRR